MVKHYDNNLTDDYLHTEKKKKKSSPSGIYRKRFHHKLVANKQGDKAMELCTE